MNSLNNEAFNIDILHIVDALPVCIFYKDTELKYRYVSKVWKELNTPNAIGKTDFEIRVDKENAVLAMDKDREIIKSGKGQQYVIFTGEEYLSVIKEPVFTKDGKVKGIAGSIVNVTEKVLSTITDSLTKTINRQGGTDAIIKSISNDTNEKFFCLIDINKFKAINDTYGHIIGDEVLKRSAQVFMNNVTSKDIVMRLGGDEFVIFFVDKKEKEVHDRIEKIFEELRELDIPALNNIEVTISVGIEKVEKGATFDCLYIRADKKMYLAKSKKDGNYVY